jgi:hypothetical protein
MIEGTLVRIPMSPLKIWRSEPQIPHSLDLDFDFVQVRLRLRDIPKLDVSLAFRIFDDGFHGSFSSLQKRS